MFSCSQRRWLVCFFYLINLYASLAPLSMTYWMRYFLLLLVGYWVLSRGMHFHQDLEPIPRFANLVYIFASLILVLFVYLFIYFYKLTMYLLSIQLTLLSVSSWNLILVISIVLHLKWPMMAYWNSAQPSANLCFNFSFIFKGWGFLRLLC